MFHTLSQSHLRWHKGSARYYQIMINKDLFNQYTLTCVWGGLNSRLGNYKTYVFEDPQEALAFINKTKRTRATRGYQMVGKLS